MSTEHNKNLKRFRNAMKLVVGSSLRILRKRRNMKNVVANWKRHGWDPNDDYREALLRALDI